MDLQLTRERRHVTVLTIALVVSVLFTVAIAQSPALTEVENLRIENLQLKAQITRTISEADACRAELAPLRARNNGDALQTELETLKTDIERAHPGFAFNIKTGKLDAKPAKP